jgi:DNA repair protein RadC
MQKGPEALKDSELLAVVLGVGSKGVSALTLAERLLRQHSLPVLLCLPVEKLKALKGLGPAKACAIRASHELSKRALSVDADVLPTIRSPADVANAAASIRKNKKENFVVLCLNARNQIIRKETISIGSLNASIVHPREVFQPAIKESAASIVLVHNHPSGDTKPSDDDIELTRRLVRAGEIMGIEVLDHVIVSEKKHLSMKELEGSLGETLWGAGLA